MAASVLRRKVLRHRCKRARQRFVRHRRVPAERRALHIGVCERQMELTYALPPTRYGRPPFDCSIPVTETETVHSAACTVSHSQGAGGEAAAVITDMALTTRLHPRNEKVINKSKKRKEKVKLGKKRNWRGFSYGQVVYRILSIAHGQIFPHVTKQNTQT